MGMLAELSNEFHKFWTRLSSGTISSSLQSRGPYPPQDAMLESAISYFCGEEANSPPSLMEEKIERIRNFDVSGMHRAVAICAAGRSGSVLLASYLDGHDDVILMPHMLSHKIYPFFERYHSFSLREKLLAFPFFKTAEADHFLDFFGGDFPIRAADYYAAVNALFEVYGDWPKELLESRKSFFQFLHVVYAVAVGWRTNGPTPMIVYAQHMLDEELARRFIEDFPQGRFIQTVRDPITTSGRLFEHSHARRGFLAAWSVVSYLTFAGLPHPSMESRTRVVRFEDLHLHLEETMRALAEWLGLAHRPSLYSSTFHGRPYVWRSGAQCWSGARPEAVNRDCRYVSVTDRVLFFALLNEEFTAWNYSCPRVFRYAWARILMCTLVLLIPMKMEFISARELFNSARRKGLRPAINGVARICICRAGIMSLVAVEIYRRIVLGKNALRMR
jgi:Sulfotransferase family